MTEHNKDGRHENCSICWRKLSKQILKSIFFFFEKRLGGNSERHFEAFLFSRALVNALYVFGTKFSFVLYKICIHFIVIEILQLVEIHSSFFGIMTKFSVINNRPIIGVAVVMSDMEKMGTYSLNTSYIKNIESSGARCVPIFPNESEEYYRRLFKKLNGLFIPGGYGAPMDFQKPVVEMVKLFYDWSIQAYNDKEHPTYWPIWGTCLGFEIIACVAAGVIDCLDRCQFCSGSHCIEFRPGYEQTRMIKALPNDLVQVNHVSF